MIPIRSLLVSIVLLLASAAAAMSPTADDLRVWSDYVTPNRTTYLTAEDDALLAINTSADEDTSIPLGLIRMRQLKSLASLLVKEIERGLPPPTAEETEAYRQANPAGFQHRDIVQLHTISLRILEPSDRPRQVAAAEEIKRRHAAGESFQDLAFLFSDATSRARGGGVGHPTREELPAAIAAMIFAAPVGEIIGPIEGRHGLNLYIVESRTLAEGAPLNFSPQEAQDRYRQILTVNAQEAALEQARSLRKGEFKPTSPEISLWDRRDWIVWQDGSVEPRDVVTSMLALMRSDVGVFPLDAWSDEAAGVESQLLRGRKAELELAAHPDYQRILALAEAGARLDWRVRTLLGDVTPTDDEARQWFETVHQATMAPVPRISYTAIKLPYVSAEEYQELGPNKAGPKSLDTMRALRAAVREAAGKGLTVDETIAAIRKQFPEAKVSAEDRVQWVGPAFDPSLFRTPKGEWSEPFDIQNVVLMLFVRDRVEEKLSFEEVRDTAMERWIGAQVRGVLLSDLERLKSETP